MPQAIRDHALIGDLRCAALVAKDGCIDWFCAPRFDSPACFTALLGEPKHGCWQLGPVDEVVEVDRRYIADTLVLQTEMGTAAGRIRITDLMPLGGDIGILRLVDGLAGEVDVRSVCTPSFHFGSCTTEPTVIEDGVMVANEDQRLILRSDCSLEIDGPSIVSQFRLKEGERRQFFLCHASAHDEPALNPEAQPALDGCVDWWRDWVSQCSYQGRWRDAVVRSLITLKALTHAPSGGIVAAPTTSLPEAPGGTANWDYRFCWIRDTVLALDVFLDSNYLGEAQAWRDWLLQLMERTRGEIRVLYDVAGQDTPAESELDWLPGYGGARPVRAGNAASEQHQLDVFGQLMDLLHSGRRSGMQTRADTWARQCELIDRVLRSWREPDEGIWELRGEPRHYTHSRVYAWVALDRSIRDAEAFGLPAPLEDWYAARDAIHHDVCTRGIDPTRGAFKQSYEEAIPDASLVMIPLLGFLPVDDERVQATLKWVREELCNGALVYRFPARQGYDGPEGAFLACSFWLIDTMLLEKRDAEAEALFERVLQLRNDVGLLAEEYHPEHGMLGNFPQALSHLALVKTAYFIDACTQAHRGGRPERFSYKPML
ncbi:Glucoamylase (glucan-1,4-alpha-glucosidase), GH15 family [Halopseudomonas xinjiangensis]|uniref:Glucoamylase (Glucan-1,4-alpha-glucosidase), GH15 family n=1 Tax=Halopseudomonas xinjiangensis TaxID=487184 RepID=A0A1H1VVW9_9GAMM|nr:glycoside hydrolase family 15 protein [Halopseudomonas xinjiangensis]SDS88396.1 Glucoamylase (glucan-1,4-alpha-glucosidase), GH15 family [Halopseudomonas xinjiangensis]